MGITRIGSNINNMTERITLTEDDIDIIHFKLTDDECNVRFCSLEGEEIVWTDKQHKSNNKSCKTKRQPRNIMPVII